MVFVRRGLVFPLDTFRFERIRQNDRLHEIPIYGVDDGLLIMNDPKGSSTEPFTSCVFNLLAVICTRITYNMVSSNWLKKKSVR